jgi:hypothetical protein
MNHSAPVVELVGLACGCTVSLAAILLLAWWLWSRFACPHGRHSSIDDSTSSVRLRDHDVTARAQPNQLLGASR